MRYFYLYIESDISLRSSTKPVAERILKQQLGLVPNDLWVHAHRLTRYHRRRYLMMELRPKQAEVLTAVMTGGGAEPLPELFTLVSGGVTLQIDTKSWGREWNDGRNRGVAQPRVKQETEYTNLEGN